MTSKRLIFVNRYFYPDHSATSQLVSELAFALATNPKWRISVVTSRLNYENFEDAFPRSETVNGVQIIRVWTSRFGRGVLLGRAIDYLTFYIAAFFRLLLLAGRGDILIAKTDPPMISVPVWLVAKIKGAKLINWLQDLFPEIARALGVRFVSGPVFVAIRALRNISLRGAAVNVAIGEIMADRIRTEAPNAKVEIIPNWKNGEEIRPVARSDNPLREEWSLSDNFVVGYSGNLGRGHDYETIASAAADLAQEADIKFLFIGGGHSFEMLKLYASAKHLSNMVFRPYQEDAQLPSSLGVPDVHLISLRSALEGLMVPSKFYGICAAARGVIFIGSELGEISTLLNRHHCGICVAEGDASKLAATIRKLRDDPATCRRLGLNARSAFDKSHNHNAAIARWDAVLDSER